MVAHTLHSDLVGRKITPVPAGVMHMHDDLPQGATYRIHTAYMETEGLPTVVAELVQWSEEGVVPPDSVKVYVQNFGELWTLVPTADVVPLS